MSWSWEGTKCDRLISDLNLMDWSASNIVTVALGKIIYLWNAGTGNIEELREFDNGDHACSLAWIQEGNILAMGGNDGTVELWDCEAKKRYVVCVTMLSTL